MNVIISFQQVTCAMWCDVCDVTCVKNHDNKRPEWTILDAMGPQNNNHPQEWEDNIVIEK